jgi:hypothetical protein
MGVAYLVVGGNLLAISGLSAYGAVVLAQDADTLQPLAIPLGLLSGVSAYYSIRFVRSGIQFLRGPAPASSAALDIRPLLRPTRGRSVAPAVQLRLQF